MMTHQVTAVRMRTKRSISLSPLRLFLGDLELIEREMTKAGVRPIWVVDEIAYSNLEDIVKQYGTELKTLAIYGVSGGELKLTVFRILFSESGGVIDLFDKSERLKLAMHELNYYLSRKSPRMRGFVWKGSPLGLIGLPTLLAMVAQDAVLPRSSVWPSLCVAVTTTMYWLVCKLWMKSYPVVLLVREHQSTTFWKRNSDNLIAGTLSGLAATLIAAYLISLY